MSVQSKVRKKFDARQYGALLARVAPVVIRTEKEYDRVVKAMNALVDKRDDITPEEDQLLDLLCLLVEQYDNEHYDFAPPPPHEMLKHLMEARDIQQKDIVHLFGNSSGRASEAINGVRAISKNQAKALAEFFKVSAELFI
jgi:HTH-type transcriptional regulator / antitoxin HigA